MSETRSPIGLGVYKGDWAGAQWTISGYPKKDMTVRGFESAYDFEELVKKKVDCKDIEFDSESCEFFAYAETKEKAIRFLNEIEQHFKKVRDLLE